MAVDLASLVIGLRADVAQLQSDLGKANALNQRYANQASDAWTASAAEIGKAMGAAVVAAAGIGAAMAKQVIDAADGFNKLSQKVGISVESLSSLNVQAKLSDISIDQLQGGLAKLARNAADAASGNKSAAATFQAMGVTLKDANGNLRSTEDLLGDVAAQFASYNDSAAKTALAQEAFGKSGAELIPLLNQLGSQGFAKAREEAEKYGQVISRDTAAAAERFNDNLTKLQLETQGFANAVVAQALPGLVKLTDAFVDAGAATNQYNDSSKVLADSFKAVVLGVIAAKETISGLVNVIFGLGDVIGAAGDLFNGFAKSVGNDLTAIGEAMRGNFSAARQALNEAGTSLSAGWEQASTRVRGAWDAVSHGVSDAVDNTKSAYNDLFGTFSNVSSGADTTAGAIKNVNAPLVQNSEASDKAAKAADQLASMFERDAQAIAMLQGKLDPVAEIVSNYVKTIIAANAAYQKEVELAATAKASLDIYAQAKQNLTTKTQLAQAAFARENAELIRQNDIVGNYLEKIANESALVGLSDRQKAITQALNEQVEAWDRLSPAVQELERRMGNLDPTTKAGAEAIAEATANLYDFTEAAKANEEVAKQWTSIWTSGADNLAKAIGDFATGTIHKFSDFGQALKDIAGQTVSAIIQYFAKLSVINPILNAIFGGSAGFSALPQMGGGIGGIVGSFFGSGDASGAATASGNASLFGTAQQGYSLFNAGQKIWDGFRSGFSSLFDTGAYTMGPPTAGGSTSSFSPGYGSTWGQALGIAGGIYAGYNRYQQAGGGAAGIAGGAAYGVGTYYAGAAAATALSTGSLAAGFAAIPVAGWIAIAALLIDKFSGGKLFGTKGEVQEGSTTLNVDSSGANYATQVSLKGQKPLFGGASWSTQDIAQTAEQAAAAQKFFDSMLKGIENYAKQYGAKAGDLVTASFQQVFDKNGRLTGETHAVIAGYNYDNLNSEQFSAAYFAANQLQVLAQFDKNLNASVEQYRASADDLIAVAQGLSQVQAYIQDGGKFLASGADQSLSAILKLAEGAEQFGETIQDALQRIIQAQAAYDQFVTQFKPATNYVDDFEGALSQINAAMLANIKQANALARAAGAAGASEQDLANIHAYAAKQMADAIAALQQSTQSLAFDLGLTAHGSLDQVDSEISRLEQQRDAYQQSLRGASDALQQAAQRAADAMNLLLGNLSPLNDQQKLQKALEGLRAGTVTQDQVLEIGRRLYASSQQYTDLFNMVRQFGNQQLAQQSGHGGGSQAATFTGADSARLTELIQVRDGLQLQRFQTLAQQIAEISSATGKDWRQVVSDMGINLSDFEAGLKLNDKQTNDLIASIQRQTDDNGENTQTLADAINRLVDFLNGDSSNADSDTRPGPHRPTGHQGGHGDASGGGLDTRVGPGDHAGHSGRGLTNDDARQIGDMIGRGIREGMNGSNRGGRSPVRA